MIGFVMFYYDHVLFYPGLWKWETDKIIPVYQVCVVIVRQSVLFDCELKFRNLLYNALLIKMPLDVSGPLSSPNLPLY